jgi:hypothetical protein
MRDEISLAQGELRADVNVVRAYGEAHPESWVELRYENEPTVRIVALFAGDDLETHRSALRRLVTHPDRVEVRPSPWTLVRLEEIRGEIQEVARSSAPGLFSGWGIGRDTVTVSLRADGEAVATRLRERYGDAVDLTIGYLHFPDCAVPESVRLHLAKAQRAKPSLLPGELHADVGEVLTVESGANIRSTMRLGNDGDHDVVAETNSHIVAVVVDPETNETVGGYSGAQIMPLVRFRAPAGGSIEIPLLVGTASSVPRLGYAVPPGQWAIEVVLALGSDGVFRAPPLPLVVVGPPHG